MARTVKFGGEFAELAVTLGKTVTVRCVNTNKLVTGKVAAAFVTGAKTLHAVAHVSVPGHCVNPVLVYATEVAD